MKLDESKGGMSSSHSHSLYYSNFMKGIDGNLYLASLPARMATSTLYTLPLRFRSYSNSMRGLTGSDHVESISAMKTGSILPLPSTSIRTGKCEGNTKKCVELKMEA